MTTFREHLEEVVGNYDASIYEGYSGRGMYSRQCIGISCEYGDVNNIIAVVGVAGAKTDSLGRRNIIYWPGFTGDEEIDLCSDCGRPHFE